MHKELYEMMLDWSYEKYDPFLKFIKKHGIDFIRNNFPEEFWKLSSDCVAVFRAMHAGEEKHGPRRETTSWTDKLNFAKSVARERQTGIVINRIDLRQEDVIILPYAVMEKWERGKIREEIRQMEIVVHDYHGRYPLENTAVLD